MPQCTSPCVIRYNRPHLQGGIKFLGSVVSKDRKPVPIRESSCFACAVERVPFCKVSCGKCLACRMNYATSWSVRCTYEAEQYEKNSFITLTYSPENLPENNELVYEHVQKFLKRLRKHFTGTTIRYYGCGEKGDSNGRPHWHILLFNCDFEDKKILKKAYSRNAKNFHGQQLDYYYYTSETLAKLWPYGFHLIGEVNANSCNYVAQYCLKGAKKTKSGTYLKRGKDFRSFMSTRPGIGAAWFYKNKKDVASKNFVTYVNAKGKYRQAPVPRYFQKLLERDCTVSNSSVCEREDSKARVRRFSYWTEKVQAIFKRSEDLDWDVQELNRRHEFIEENSRRLLRVLDDTS